MYIHIRPNLKPLSIKIKKNTNKKDKLGIFIKTKVKLRIGIVTSYVKGLNIFIKIKLLIIMNKSKLNNDIIIINVSFSNSQHLTFQFLLT